MKLEMISTINRNPTINCDVTDNSINSKITMDGDEEGGNMETYPMMTMMEVAR